MCFDFSQFENAKCLVINCLSTINYVGFASISHTKVTDLETHLTGLIFDVSEANNRTSYESLSDALSVANDILKPEQKNGGMTIKYVQTSDNKYVQYRYMGTAVTGNPNPFLDTANWQGVDKELVSESHNLAESGAVYNELYKENRIDVALTNSIDGYIQSNGNIHSSNSFIIKYIACRKGDLYKLSYENYISTSARCWAIYSTDDIDNVSSDTLLAVGPVGATDVEIEILVNDDNAAILLIQDLGSLTTPYNPSLKKVSYSNKFEAIDTKLEADTELLASNKIAYKIDGENLYAAYNNNGEEITYWFKKCMANNLYTFYKIGYRIVDRVYPSTDGIDMQTDIIPINSTASDNIGPLKMSNGGWVGGNYKLAIDDKSYFTAVCNRFNISANGNNGLADSITIEVENTIFDPSIVPSDPQATILSTPLCTEYVTYKIVKNTIEVSVSHKFVGSTTNVVQVYHGMQSNFVDEDYIITPNGEFTDWIGTNGDLSFNKEDYPLFNRYIEKNTVNQTYQSAYLINSFGLGNHEGIEDTDDIFLRSGNKDHHKLIYHSSVYTSFANKLMQWAGSYTFFHTPIVDNEKLLVYRGVIRGVDTLFVNTKESYNGSIPVPKDLALSNIYVKECNGITSENGDTNFQIGGNGIYIESPSTGSLILVFGTDLDKVKNDINILSRSIIVTRDWVISGNVLYDNNEIPISYDITWADGTSGTVVMSDFNSDVFEYTTITATYGGAKTIVYTLTYDVNGYITNETYVEQ